MKTASSTSYRVSNNFSTTTRSGRVSGGAGARSKDEESSRIASKRGSKANAEAPEAMLAGTAGTPAKQAKRRDQKATPDSHAITKAKEMATRKDGNPTAGTAPITDLTGGSGGTGQERAPLGRDDLASAKARHFSATWRRRSRLRDGKPSNSFVEAAKSKDDAAPIFSQRKGSLRSGRRWVVELLKKLWNTSWDLWMMRNYQLKSGHDEEAMGLLMMLDRHVLHLLGQGAQHVPQELLPLLRCSPHHLLRRPVEAKLAWIDKIQLGREHLLGRQAPPAIRGHYRRRFIVQ